MSIPKGATARSHTRIYITAILLGEFRAGFGLSIGLGPRSSAS